MTLTTTTPQLRWSALDISRLLGQAHQPTAEQIAVIEAPLEPFLVVAGAGSGKTETMAARVVYLIANGLVAPEKLLGLTFTKKAAGELLARVSARLKQLDEAVGGMAGAASETAFDGVLRPTVATYNAYAGSLVRDHGLRLGIEPDSRLLTEAGLWQLASDVVESCTEDLGIDSSSSTVIRAVIALSGQISEHLVSPEDVGTFVDRFVSNANSLPFAARQTSRTELDKLLAPIADRSAMLTLVERFRARKRELEYIDFGDQIALGARLAREVPAVGALERERYEVVLLDEYQDTSTAQIEFLAGLFGNGHPVTAVGDPHQSIYGWRGASAGGLTRFPTRFPRADGTPCAVLTLSTSWRNDVSILGAANVTASDLRSGMAVDVPELAARPGAPQGAVTAMVSFTAQDEADSVAQWLAQRWESGSAAVLCRKRSQFPTMAAALRKAGLPVEVVGLGGLLNAPEIQDIVALLTTSADPSRGDSLMRLLTGPRWNIGVSDLHALGAFSSFVAKIQDQVAGGTDQEPDTHQDADASIREGGGVDANVLERDNVDADVLEGDEVDARSIVDALDSLTDNSSTLTRYQSTSARQISHEGIRRLTEISLVLRSLRNLTSLSLPEIVIAAERALGLDVEVTLREGRDHLDAFRTVASSFASSADHPSITGFLAYLESAQDRERGLELPLHELDPNAIQLMTVHAAKGLEWDVVAVPGLADGTLPSSKATRDGLRKDSGWLTDRGTLPYPLRGDSADLPVFDWRNATTVKELTNAAEEFRALNGEHQLAEERRLAYVAFTRARHELLLTSHWWDTQKTSKKLSPFLLELVDASIVSPDGWAASPEEGGINPSAGEVATAIWPRGDSAETAHNTVHLRAAAQVRLAMAQSHLVGTPGPGTAEPGTPGSGAPGPGTPEPGTSAHALDSRAAELVETAQLLLAERHASLDNAVHLPQRISASGLVSLAANSDEYARQLRRPVPVEPTVAARRGTTFHEWVEQHYTAPSALFNFEDLDGLHGIPDPTADDTLEALKKRFQESPWYHLSPLAVEQAISVPLGGIMISCKIDAVFPDGPQDSPGTPPHVTVVDWKTGHPPRTAADRTAREIQLAVYRIAWARWKGIPLSSVQAAFYYAATGETVHPTHLHTEEELVDLISHRQPPLH
ncbi:MAG: ATP-dependent helicase [Cellulomonadaceae bacterium]|jgi:DNA helicase-2/ATP-dependent DNA helicase PcrA|nr:ATP-dependent helicase [Cellulomonadaceae bacterium]